jgi:hypothetical protein
MASVYNNPSSQDWYASFKNADGKWVARSTKTTKKDDALCIAHERKRWNPTVPEAVQAGFVAEYLEKYVEGKAAQGRSPK